MIKLVLLALIASISACSTGVTMLRSSSEPRASKDQARVFFARTNANFHGSATDYIINEALGESSKVLGALARGQCMIQVTQPGKHTYFLSGPWGKYEGVEVTLDLKVAKDYYMVETNAYKGSANSPAAKKVYAHNLDPTFEQVTKTEFDRIAPELNLVEKANSK